MEFWYPESSSVTGICSCYSWKGAPLNFFGLIDGTVRPIFRPGQYHRVLYNDHKCVHSMKSLEICMGLFLSCCWGCHTKISYHKHFSFLSLRWNLGIFSWFNFSVMASHLFPLWTLSFLNQNKLLAIISRSKITSQSAVSRLTLLTLRFPNGVRDWYQAQG